MARRDLAPIVIAMGRGGPPAPQVAEAGSVTLDRLIALVQAGEHAASDYLEDALTTGVTTIGARRAAGGLAGAPYATNVGEAVAIGAERHPGLLVLEGSGRRCRPSPGTRGPGRPGACPPEYISGYLGPTACCGPTWLLLPCQQARFPGPRTSPSSPLTCVVRWAMRGS